MPRGKKCAVCLTFDFDAISVWPGALKVSSPTYISRGEFGAIGAQRILDLLDQYKIKATWAIPGHTIDTYPEICKKIHQKGHEICHHGYLHETPVTLSRDQEEKILKKGIGIIKRLTGSIPKGYRSPAWDLSPNSIELLLEYGFRYDSSLMGSDYIPYRCRLGDKFVPDGPYKFGKEIDMVEIPVSWSLDDFPAFEFVANTPWNGLRSSSDVYENWRLDFDYMYDRVPNGVYTLTMHPQVIGRGHRMITLERLIQHMTSRPGVWFTRMVEIANAFKPK